MVLINVLSLQNIYKHYILIRNMKKLVGYIVSIVGLAIMAISFGLLQFDLPILQNFNPIFVTIGGIVIIVVGIGLTMMGEGGRRKQKSVEVPIYEGKEIVGYRRSN